MSKPREGESRTGRRFIGTLEMKPCWSTPIVVDGNYARQLLVRQANAAVTSEGENFQAELASGEVINIVRHAFRPKAGRTLFVPPSAHLEHYSRFTDVQGCKWLGDREPSTAEDVVASLDAAFQFREDAPRSPGLRVPQLGALHSLLGYWTTDPREPATVVMPTGTGKTEAMVAVFCQASIKRLLILVPSDALREQLAKKFESYGVLQTFGVVAWSALRPVVGQLRHGLTEPTSALDFANKCNVVVATPNAVSACDADAKDQFLDQFSHLFVDEAHHLGASTWQAVRDRFVDRKVVQFTATPFREDGKALKGKIVYAFPLREAQRQGYFSQIDYVSVPTSADPDRAIAAAAIDRLRKDREAGYDHLIMARVDRIGRAKRVLQLYVELAPELKPVSVHSQSKKTERMVAFEAIEKRTSRIIVCVNMLGEGFDLPQLKIAAMHDAHKSLGVTLQFIGRFARGTSDLGRASIVVGKPTAPFDTRLHELYRQDADWNKVIRDLAQDAVETEEALGEFERGFNVRADSTTLQMLEPKMSTVVFAVQGSRWHLSGIHAAFKEGQIFGDVSVNETAKVAWFLTRNLAPVRWGVAPELTEITYDLYVIYWDQDRGLLHLNSSNTDSRHEVLAEKLFRGLVSIVSGDIVYRSMAGISRLIPTNVGVLDSRSHARRFSMHVGADVSFGFPVTDQVTKTQTNIFAVGFEGGERVTIGASLKGRIWCHRVASSVLQWVRWCNRVGAKLVNDGLSIDSIIKNFIRPIPVESRPDFVFLAAEWPWQFYLGSMEETRLEFGDHSCALLDVDLRMTEFSAKGLVYFDVVAADWSARYEVKFEQKGMLFEPIADDVRFKTRRESSPLSEVFAEYGLTFLLERDAMIVHPSMLLKPNRDIPPFDSTRINVLQWAQTNLSKESQGQNKDPTSIQWRVIQHILADRDWKVVLDDDGSGEAADIVAFSGGEQHLKVLLVHCKFASVGKPASRIEDLYEVCGQAQKSVRWARDLSLTMENLIRRERQRASRGSSGFARGNLTTLLGIADRIRTLRPSFTVAIAQPGLSRANVSDAQLQLLACTEIYLNETYGAAFEVIASA